MKKLVLQNWTDSKAKTLLTKLDIIDSAIKKEEEELKIQNQKTRQVITKEVPHNFSPEDYQP